MVSSISPCTGVCKLEEATGFCLGCARTADEIANWRQEADAWRNDIWDALPQRFEALGVSCRRLPCDVDEIRSFVVRSLKDRAGTWVAGVVGAVGEFTAAPGQSVEVELQGDFIVATTPGARLRFLIDEHIRALTFEPKETPPEKMRVVLAVKRYRGRPEVANALAMLGKDNDAIEATDRDENLFDLGLGRKEARFCVRVEPGSTQDVLISAIGATFPESLPKIAPNLLATNPTRVIESALGRVEISTPIPAPNTQPSNIGSHTHLLPEHIASGRALPTGMDLPRAYLPGAVFYPKA